MNIYQQFPIGARVIFTPQNNRERYFAKRGWSGTVVRHSYHQIVVHWDKAPEYLYLAYSGETLSLINSPSQSAEDFL